MIRSFADKRSAEIFFGESTARTRRIASEVIRATVRKLAQLDATTRLEDLRIPPGNRLEALRGSRAGHYSIRINNQWRIVFRWEGDGPHDVEFTDYH